MSNHPTRRGAMMEVLEKAEREVKSVTLPTKIQPSIKALIDEVIGERHISPYIRSLILKDLFGKQQRKPPKRGTCHFSRLVQDIQDRVQMALEDGEITPDESLLILQPVSELAHRVAHVRREEEAVA